MLCIRSQQIVSFDISKIPFAFGLLALFVCSTFAHRLLFLHFIDRFSFNFFISFGSSFFRFFGMASSISFSPFFYDYDRTPASVCLPPLNNHHVFDRFQVPLSAPLSVENAAQVLLSADYHSYDELFERTISFICKHQAAVVKTNGWKMMRKWEPYLVAEVVVKGAVLRQSTWTVPPKSPSIIDNHYFYLLDRLHTILQKYSSGGSRHEVTDMRTVLSGMRFILKDVRLVFTGVAQTVDGPPDQNPFYQLASSLGACNVGVVNSTTTHVIAIRNGDELTAKLEQATKFPNISIVDPSWLLACVEEGRRVDEKLFPPWVTAATQPGK